MIIFRKPVPTFGIMLRPLTHSPLRTMVESDTAIPAQFRNECFSAGGEGNRLPRRIDAVDAQVAPGSEKGMAGNESDESLMALVAQGDQRAFRILMGRHMGLAIRVAQRVVGDGTEADDIGQDAFLRVWSRASSFDPRVARFTTWLYRVVLNLSLDRVRKPKHAPIDEAAGLRSDDPEPIAVMIEDEQRRMVCAALAGLHERQRAAIVLFHMEGLSGREAAQAMNVSEKAFESLLVRGRVAIKQYVEARANNTRRCA
jgi:RNA polymerase sigma-70 factor (ECF subfamily)